MMGIISMAVLGMNPLAFALAVFAGDWLGPRYLLVLGGALLLATGVWALTSRFFRNIK